MVLDEISTCPETPTFIQGPLFSDKAVTTVIDTMVAKYSPLERKQNNKNNKPHSFRFYY
jgi:hypothetical protein